MVVVYKMNALSYLLGRALVRVDHVALPNLILGRRAVPELIQGAATPDAMASALVPLLVWVQPGCSRRLGFSQSSTTSTPCC